MRNSIYKVLSKIVTNFLAIICALLIATVCFTFYAIQKTEISKNKIVLINHNTSTREIAKELVDKNIIKHRTTFYFFAKLYCKVFNKHIIAGEYSLKGVNDILELMKVLTAGKVIQHKISIPEGFTIKQLTAKIANLNNIRHFPDNITVIQEGSILPETYFYTYGTLDIHLIKRMQSAMNDFMIGQWIKRDKALDNIISSPTEAIILASIIEKETYIDNEKPLIAGVYLNRLKKNMRLQADPTVVYGLQVDDNWDRRLLYSHLKTDSLYNTYMYNGLPPTAICNPSKASILAVLHPEWTQKLFFVAGNGGKHVFATNFDQHKKNIKTIRETK